MRKKEKPKEKNEKKSKRETSIITIILWLFLIATMITITLNGISRNNALETVRTITLKVDFKELLEDESYDETEKNNIITNLLDMYLRLGENKYYEEDNIVEYETSYLGLENNIATYEVNITSGKANYIEFWLDGIFCKYSITENNNQLELYNEDVFNLFVKELEEGKDTYEFKLEKREGIRINIDYSDISEVGYYDIVIVQNGGYISYGYFIEGNENSGIFEVYPILNMDYDIMIYTDMNVNEVIYENNTLDVVQFDGCYYCKKVSKEDVKKEYDFKLKRKSLKIKVKDETGTIKSEDDIKIWFMLYGMQRSGDANFISKDSEYYYFEIPDWRRDYDYNDILIFVENSENIAYYRIKGYNYYILSDNIKIYNTMYYLNTILGEEIEIHIIDDNESKIKNRVEWIDEENKVANITMEYEAEIFKGDGNGSGIFYGYLESKEYKPLWVYYYENELLYTLKLDGDFEILEKYYDDSEWKILNLANIPIEDIIEEMNNSNTKYVYDENTRTIYWHEKLGEIENKKGLNVEVRYIGKDEGNINIIDESYVYSLYNKGFGCGINYYKVIYSLENPKLEILSKDICTVNITKISNKNLNEKCYIGIFENEKDEKTDDIREFNINGMKGEFTFTIQNYNNSKDYYIYEVDKNGNKIVSNNLTYSGNKIEAVKDKEYTDVSTNENIVSSYEGNDHAVIVSNRWYYSFDKNDDGDIDSSKEYNLSDTKIDYAKIRTKSKSIESKNNSLEEITEYVSNHEIYYVGENEYVVRYVAEDGGSIVGESEEIVSSGKVPQNVPMPKADEGYEFLRWEVEKDGERIRVEPSKYIINDDTVFYAVFNKVPVDINTSDINVWLYIVIFVFASIMVVSIMVFVIKGKNAK